MFFWRKKSEITRCKRNTQNLSDNLYLMLCCAAHSPLDPRFPGHIHALCVQRPSSAESSCAVFCHHAVNSPHRGDSTPRPVPHLEHRDSSHPEEFSWRQQVKQHKATGACAGEQWYPLSDGCALLWSCCARCLGTAGVLWALQ